MIGSKETSESGAFVRQEDYDWHTAPRRQYILMLTGVIQIEVGDGTKRRFAPGDVLLVEDTTGRGHRTKLLTDEIRRSVFVTLE